MTIAMDRPDLSPIEADVAESRSSSLTPEDTQRVSWSSPAKWLWIAETQTEYLGMVDRNYDGYAATSFDGHDLGIFSARADAQLAVYGYWFQSGGEK